MARDPGSASFVALAEAYRRQGRREEALQVCLRGLEKRPTDVAGHALLARLYLEAGDRVRACDEWAIVLSLDPDNFEAHRGMGFYQIEQRNLEAALEHLRRAEAQRPGDQAVREGLSLVRARLAKRREHVGQRAPQRAAEEAPQRSAQRAPARPGIDPARLFEPLREETPFLGALIVDAQGLVLAGGIEGGEWANGEALGAIVSSVVEDAVRATSHTTLGAWRGMLVETEQAAVHLAPLRDDLMVVLVAMPGAPPGWILRAAARAAALASAFVEARS